MSKARLTANELQAYLNFAESVMRQSGDIARRYFTHTINAQTKSADNTPVTIADMAINQLVVDEVKTHYPSIGVLGEEASHKVENLNDLLWVCDPIDGTIPYMLHITASTGCLALVQDGEPVVGVVYDYMSDRMFSAVKGGGALLNGKPFKPSGRPMKMVDIGVWPDSIFDISKLSRTLLAQRYQQPNFCSHAFACMLVAQRRIAGAVYPGSKPWDGAASKVILSELGVKMTDIHGSEQRFDGKLNGLIVGYPETHQLLVSSI